MQIARRTALAGLLGVVAVGSTSGCTSSSTGFQTPGESLMAAINRVEAARFSSNKTTKLEVTQRLAKVDLGEGSIVEAKTCNGLLPGAPLRANYGDLVKLTQKNELAEATSIHIHGLALRNDADGVPMLTQAEVAQGASFVQSFKAPHPGTYWYHSHNGLQPESGLYGSFIIDDPSEPGDYDAEWILMLDDWTLGLGDSPDQVLEKLKGASTGDSHGMHGMSGMGMDMGNMSGMSDMTGIADQFGLGMGLSDVAYPTYLINGRRPGSPDVFVAKPGQRVRLRIINAASDTAFVFGVYEHDLTVTHTDGFAVKPKTGKAVLLGMGERIDAIITLKQGAHSVFAVPVGKEAAAARAVISTGTTPLPSAAAAPDYSGAILQVSDLQATEDNQLTGKPSASLQAMLMGQMAPYAWNINNNTDMHATLFELREGETVDLTFMNHTMMFHPMHLHGHTFQVVNAYGKALPNGPRKDTVIVKPMSSVIVRVQADNPGDWALHCHNGYHMETGMMGAIRYKL